VSNEIARSAAKGLAAVGAVRWWLDSSARTEFRNIQEVVSRAGQQGGEAGALHAAIAGAAEVADPLEPAEDLFDPFCARADLRHIPASRSCAG